MRKEVPLPNSHSFTAPPPAHLLLLQGFLWGLLCCLQDSGIVNSLCEAHGCRKHLKRRKMCWRTCKISKGENLSWKQNSYLSTVRKTNLFNRSRRLSRETQTVFHWHFGSVLYQRVKKKYTMFIRTLCRREQVHVKKPTFNTVTHTYLRGDAGILGGLRVGSEQRAEAIFHRLLQRRGWGVLKNRPSPHYIWSGSACKRWTCKPNKI